MTKNYISDGKSIHTIFIYNRSLLCI